MDVVVVTDDEGVPRLRFSEPYNAAEHFIDRHLLEGLADKPAIRTVQREVTYAELADTTNRHGNALTSLWIPSDCAARRVERSAISTNLSCKILLHSRAHGTPR